MKTGACKIYANVVRLKVDKWEDLLSNVTLTLGELFTPTDGASPKSDPNSNASTTVWSWPNEVFYPNQGKMYVAGQGCPSGRSPAGCGCLNGDLNVPVVGVFRGTVTALSSSTSR